MNREELVDELVKAANLGFDYAKEDYEWEEIEPGIREAYWKIYVEGMTQEELEEFS